MKKQELDKMTLVEVGPRFCLNPVRIFAGSFGGASLFVNGNYISPNEIRAKEKKQNSKKYGMKVKAKKKRKRHMAENEVRHL